MPQQLTRIAPRLRAAQPYLGDDRLADMVMPARPSFYYALRVELRALFPTYDHWLQASALLARYKRFCRAAARAHREATWCDGEWREVARMRWIDGRVDVIEQDRSGRRRTRQITSASA